MKPFFWLSLVLCCISLPALAQGNLSLPEQREVEMYSDISLTSPDGSMLKLSAYVGPGKYVLLDFWASWCGPCMGEVPYLKEAYTQYHAKGFEIYGVSLDRDQQPWLKTIEEKGMNWIHVYLDSNSNRDRKFTTAYGVKAIPSNFLIAPDGSIVAKNLRGDDLATTLAKYL